MSIISAKSQTGHDLPAFETPDGQLRLLGVIPGLPAYRATAWAASPYPKIDPKDYKDFAFNRRRTSLPIWNQLQEGSCVPHGLLRAYMKSRIDSGQSDVMLSRAMAYAMVNGGRDAGANPADLIEVLTTIGVCTEATVPYRFLVSGQIGPAARAEALRFVADPEGVFTCADFDEAVNAAIYGCHLGVTIFVHGDWNRLDANGCPPAYRGTGNHEMNGGDALSIAASGEPLLELDQSWGPEWCNGGRCNARRAHFDNQPDLQIYAFKFPGQDPLDPDLGPVAA